MLDNKYCNIQDLLLDDAFVDWVLGNAVELDSYFEEFLLKHPECEENFAQAASIVSSLKIKPVKDLSHQQIDEMIATVTSNRQAQQPPEIIVYPKRKIPTLNLLRYAAVVTFFVCLSWLGYYVVYKNKSAPVAQTAMSQTYRKVTNKSLGNMLIKLPDNSSVILKPLAQLRYPDFFTGKKREVYLTGEAFFEVSKNPQRPFFVYSNELTVRVVGTSFIVKAEDGAAQFKVTVSTGKVEVSMADKLNARATKQSILLMPNQQATLYRNNLNVERIILKKPLLLSKESAAIHFNFVGTAFPKVVSTIEEAYGVNIIYDEKVMGNCQLTASLIDQPLDERLRLICKAVEAEYKVIDGHIVIDGKGCNN